MLFLDNWPPKQKENSVTLDFRYVSNFEIRLNLTRNPCSVMGDRALAEKRAQNRCGIDPKLGRIVYGLPFRRR
jgi:hypothetical protein